MKGHHIHRRLSPKSLTALSSGPEATMLRLAELEEIAEGKPPFIEESVTNPFRHDPIGAKFVMLQSVRTFGWALKAYLTERWSGR